MDQFDFIHNSLLKSLVLDSLLLHSIHSALIALIQNNKHLPAVEEAVVPVARSASSELSAVAEAGRFAVEGEAAAAVDVGFGSAASEPAVALAPFVAAAVETLAQSEAHSMTRARGQLVGFAMRRCSSSAGKNNCKK